MAARAYDYIIAGMGCAGLSLALRLSEAGLTRHKRILLIDREQKNVNNRTWCFWETGPGFFEPVVHRSWSNAWFHSKDFSSLLQLHPYQYKMIRGLDFNNYCMQKLQADPAFEIIYDEVLSVESAADTTICHTVNGSYEASWLFNSILFKKPTPQKGTYVLLQHFKGWVIRTNRPVFDPATATLMDFRPHQQHGTTFVYVMPLSATEALVEYTLFTPSLLEDQAYDEGLNHYIRDYLHLDQWEVIEEEFGVIPMTNHKFPKHNHRIIHMGTAGGMTKASSGYTFNFIQKDAEEMVKQIQRTGKPIRQTTWAGRFHWYDSVLLNILHHKTLQGDAIFTDLFQHNPAHTILKFLDNETGIGEDLKIMWSLPQWPFMKAGLEEAGKLVRRLNYFSSLI